jgi:hypothetical protein
MSIIIDNKVMYYKLTVELNLSVESVIRERSYAFIKKKKNAATPGITLIEILATNVQV